jgi:chromosome segregation ATPase
MLKVFKKENKLNRKIKTAKNTIGENKEKITEYKKRNRGKTGRISRNDNKRQKYKQRIKKLTKENKILRGQLKKYKEYIKQLQKYMEQISQIFQQETQVKARKEFQRLLNKTEKLPLEIATFINNLSRTIEKSIQHLKHSDIPNTNNLIEGYFKITLPRHLKRKYRTLEGILTKLRQNRIRSTQRKLQQMK